MNTSFLRRMLAFVVCILILHPLQAQEIRWSYDVNGDGSVTREPSMYSFRAANATLAT